jgi:hypothetical protein
MSNIVEDLRMRRLIRAFQKVTDPAARRTIVIFVEEQVQKQGAKKPEDHLRGPAELGCLARRSGSFGIVRSLVVRFRLDQEARTAHRQSSCVRYAFA